MPAFVPSSAFAWVRAAISPARFCSLFGAAGCFGLHGRVLCCSVRVWTRPRAGGAHRLFPSSRKSLGRLLTDLVLLVILASLILIWFCSLIACCAEHYAPLQKYLSYVAMRVKSSGKCLVDSITTSSLDCVGARSSIARRRFQLPRFVRTA